MNCGKYFRRYMFSLVVLEIILANTRTQPIKFICTNNEDKDVEFI
jgi:hypothetical protein